MSSNTTVMNIPANMVGIVEKLMELGKMGVGLDVVVDGQVIGKLASASVRSVGATDEEIQQMLDRSTNAYNLFCAKNFRDAEKENPDPANRKETYRILGPRWTALKNDPLRHDEFRSYHVPYLKEDAISMSGRKWSGVPEKPKLRRSDEVVPEELEDVCPGCESGVDSSCAHCDEDGNYPHPNCVSVPEYSAKKERVVRIDEHNELMDDVADGCERGGSQYQKKWKCLVCTKQNLRGVYNCVCCGRIVGTVPEHPGLCWKSSEQVWDVPTEESKVKRGYNNYANHYRKHFKGQGFSRRNITRKISAGWQSKSREEKEKWADWEWAEAEARRLRESWPYKK